MKSQNFTPAPQQQKVPPVTYLSLATANQLFVMYCLLQVISVKDRLVQIVMGILMGTYQNNLVLYPESQNNM